MDDTKPSLSERVLTFPAGAPIQGAAFLAEVPVLIREDGTLDMGAPGGVRRVAAHADGAILASAATPDVLYTGGDDGRVVRTSADGTTETIHDSGGAWIDALAGRDDGSVAWAIGKTVFARDARGTIKQHGVPTTGRGLAFAPKGYRVAIAHYNGVSLWFPNTAAAPEMLEWKGSHLDVSFSRDGRFVVSAMQENALHGWRLGDKANMRMSGYPAKVRSQSWSADGLWLATSGADTCVVWPFRDKDGPMRKPPHELAMRKARVSRVAFHPKTLVLAVGYEDGWVLLARMTDTSELLVRRPDADRQPVTALAWSADGETLLFGTAAGEAGLLALPKT